MGTAAGRGQRGVPAWFAREVGGAHTAADVISHRRQPGRAGDDVPAARSARRPDRGRIADLPRRPRRRPRRRPCPGRPVPVDGDGIRRRPARSAPSAAGARLVYLPAAPLQPDRGRGSRPIRAPLVLAAASRSRRLRGRGRLRARHHLCRVPPPAAGRRRSGRPRRLRPLADQVGRAGPPGRPWSPPAAPPAHRLRAARGGRRLLRLRPAPRHRAGAGLEPGLAPPPAPSGRRAVGPPRRAPRRGGEAPPNSGSRSPSPPAGSGSGSASATDSRSPSSPGWPPRPGSRPSPRPPVVRRRSPRPPSSASPTRAPTRPPWARECDASPGRSAPRASRARGGGAARDHLGAGGGGLRPGGPGMWLAGETVPETIPLRRPWPARPDRARAGRPLRLRNDRRLVVEPAMSFRPPIGSGGGGANF